jgi:hypothetical protein
MSLPLWEIIGEPGERQVFRSEFRTRDQLRLAAIAL